MRPLLLLAPLLCLAAAPQPGERGFMVPNFQRLRVEGPFDVEVLRGSPKAVAIGAARALDQVSVQVEGGTMVIGTGPLGWEARKGITQGLPKLRVWVPALESVVMNGGPSVRVAEMRGTRVELVLNGTGSLDVGTIKTDDLRASLTGTGAMRFAGSAGRARIRNFGAGSIDAGTLIATDADLVSESSGSLRINVRYTARAAALGSGGISILGKPQCRLRGAGPIDCGGTIVGR